MTETGEIRLKVKLFGRFEVWRDGILLDNDHWPQAKTQALLKLLVTERGKIFTKDQLLELLFPNVEPDKASQNLHGRLSELRKALEPRLKKGTSSQYVLSIGRQGYSFSKEASCSVDIEIFQQHIELAQSEEKRDCWSEALENYKKALEIYRGDYLPEDLYEEWTEAPREHWRELFLKGLLGLADAHARLGQYAEAVEACKKAIQHKVTLESAYRREMLYLYLKGESSEAQQVYQACAHALKENLEVEPSGQTSQLAQAIAAGDISQINIDGIYPKIAARAQAIRDNLPSQVSSFIGREREKTKIKWELAQTRLLTLTGAGGSGKTRLSLQVASELLKNYPDGVWWIELAALHEAPLVAETIATALGIKEEPKRPLMQTLIEALKTKNLLLVLDNCEHLIQTCAKLTEKILSTCPQVQMLATSREALGIRGETVWAVPTLALPNLSEPLPPLKILLQYEAVSLFVERALAGTPQFVLNEVSAATIVQICTQLDGLPLAIELAAARVKVLSVDQIAERLKDRFKLLTSGSRTAQPRQQTLKAAIDWGYELLSENEKKLFARLSIFAGNFSLEACEAICADESMSQPDGKLAHAEILDLLTQLVDKSFVTVERNERESRYRLLESLREYGIEKLIQSEEYALAQNRYVMWYTKLAEQSSLELSGPKQAREFDRLETEHDHLRAALGWFSKSQQPELGLRLALKLHKFWEVRGHWSEGQRWLELFLAEEKNKLFSVERAAALRALNHFVKLLGDFPKARALVQEALSISERLSDKQGMAQALGNLGGLAWEQGDYATAHQHHEASLKIKRELNDSAGIASTLSNLGVIAFEQGNYDRAYDYFSEGLTINKASGDIHSVAATLGNLGVVIQHKSDFATARKHYEESLKMHRELGSKRFIALTLHRMGSLAHMQADYETSRALHQESLAIRKELGDPINSSWSLYHLGRAARYLGDFDQARNYHCESLKNFEKLGIKQGLLFNLRGLTALETSLKRFERATKIGSSCERFRLDVGFVFPPNEQAEFDQCLTEIKNALGEMRFAKDWDEGQRLTLEKTIELALVNDLS